MGKKALITGITGQDGPYLAELLLEKDYEVFGMVRRSSAPNYWRFKRIIGQIHLVDGDLLDPISLIELLRKVKPDEIYNLAAQSHVGRSFEQPGVTLAITGKGAVDLILAARDVAPEARFYQASSSEMFGDVRGKVPQNEETPFNPANPYAVAKLYAHHMARIYRREGMFITSGILFNHESPKRGEHFVTSKVAYGAACCKIGVKNSDRLDEKGKPMVRNGKLVLGNLDAVRDWGFAGDYVEAMWLMVQREEPDEFVIATGVGHTIKDLCEVAFSHVGLNWREYVETTETLVRPYETGPLIGDASKAKKILGWRPKTSFEELIAMMVDAELASLR